MTKLLLSLSAATLMFSTTTQAAGNASAGKAKTATCVACHGPAGISAVGMYPNLAGQKEEYLVKQIKAFRSGTRVDPTMAPMVKALSEQDIKDIAAYYASLGGSSSDSSGGKKRRRR